jgi:p-methyltransferase
VSAPAKVLLLSEEEGHPLFEDSTAYFTLPFVDAGDIPAITALKSPALAPVLLGTILREAGCEVRLFDGFLTSPRRRAELEEALRAGPDVVGLSLTHLFREETVSAVAAMVRALAPGARLLFGGADLPRLAGTVRLADAAALGRGEGSVVEAVKALAGGMDLARVPGLLLLRGGTALRTPAPALRASGMPTPDWRLAGSPKAVVVQGRLGCPRRCAFCSYPEEGEGWERSVPEVVAEIRLNRERAGIRHFRLADSDFLADTARARAFCDGLVREAPDLSWSCFARADGFLRDPGIAARMRAAGCAWVFVGLESGSPRMLEVMEKGCTLQEMEEGTRRAREAGLRVHGNFVVGFPGETDGSVDETLSFLSKGPVDTAYFGPFQVRSERSPVWERRERWGLSGDGVSWRHRAGDSDQARAWVRRCIETVVDMDGPLIGNECSFSTSLLRGPGSEDAVFRSLFLLRDYHRARRAGDDGRRVSLARRIAEHLK